MTIYLTFLISFLYEKSKQNNDKESLIPSSKTFEHRLTTTNSFDSLKQLNKAWQYEKDDEWIFFNCNECIIIELNFRIYNNSDLTQAERQKCK